MKLLCSFLVLVSFGLFSSNLHADPLLAVNAGAAGGVLVETPVAGGESWVYTDTNVTVLGLGLAQVTNQTFTATFTDLLGNPVLNVTDVCADVNVLAPPEPCNALAFTFTDAGLGTPVLDSNVALLGALGLDLNVDAVGLDTGASIGGGYAQIGFSNPPSATPEPGSLSLLGTGLLGIAGVVRKRFFAV